MRRLYGAIALSLGISVCGCSEPETAPPAAPQPSASVIEGPSPSQLRRPQPVAGDANPQSPQAQAKQSAKFDPPYQDRVEIFLPPSRKHSVAKSTSNSEVQLRGFVRVDRPKALLVVDGKLRALAAGEQFGGIEVIQIEQPLVTLQRGRVRWTEALYPRG